MPTPKPALRRRTLLVAGAALPLVAIGRARAAEFTYKLATGQSPTNPINLRLKEAIDRITKATNGRLAFRLFPNNQLGSDTDQITQLRSGGIDILNVAASVLSTVVPDAALVNLGFAFPNYDAVWKAVDGPLGQYIQGRIAAVGLVPLAPMGNNGFRQITSSSHAIDAPADLRGFKIRVPEAPLFTGLFRALGASPTAINFNEVYTALQTHLVDGEENGLVTVETAKLYEVQKYCSMTNHIWDGFCVMANPASFKKLPPDVQAIVMREIKQAVMDQRADETKLDASLRGTLEKRGMTFADPKSADFQAALQKTSFYKDWKAKFGAEGWRDLEAVTGALG